MSQPAGLVNFATNLGIWDWRRRHIMRGHGASGIGLRAVASFHEKREPTFVSSPGGQQKVGLECRRRFRTIDHRVPAFRRQKARPRSATSALKKNANWGPWGLQLISDSSEQKALAEYKQLQKRYQSVLGDRAPLVLKRQLGGRGPIDMVLCASRRNFPTTSQPTLLALGICRRKLPRFSQLEPLQTVSHYRLLAAMAQRQSHLSCFLSKRGDRPFC